MSVTTDSSTAPSGLEVELAVGGMTCASCAARVEKKLGKLDGVAATVNYATEKAKVTYPEGLDPQQLVGQVEAASYTTTLPQPAGEDAPSTRDIQADDPTKSTPSGSRAERWPRSRATCSGPSPTTSPPYAWPRPDCSTP